MSRRDAVLTTGLVLLTMSALSCRPSPEAIPLAAPAMPTPPAPDPTDFTVPYATDPAQIDEWLKVPDRYIYLTPEEVEHVIRTHPVTKLPDTMVMMSHISDNYNFGDRKWVLHVWKNRGRRGILMPSHTALALFLMPDPSYFQQRFILLSDFDDKPLELSEPG